MLRRSLFPCFIALLLLVPKIFGQVIVDGEQRVAPFTIQGNVNQVTVSGNAEAIVASDGEVNRLEIMEQGHVSSTGTIHRLAANGDSRFEMHGGLIPFERPEFSGSSKVEIHEGYSSGMSLRESAHLQMFGGSISQRDFSILDDAFVDVYGGQLFTTFSYGQPIVNVYGGEFTGEVYFFENTMGQIRGGQFETALTISGSSEFYLFARNVTFTGNI